MNISIADIIMAKLRREALSREEEELFAQWYDTEDNKTLYYEWKRMDAAIYANMLGDKNVCPKWKDMRRRQKSLYFVWRYVGIACILAGLFFLWYSVNSRFESSVSGEKGYANERVVLTLSDGRKIFLDDPVYRGGYGEEGILIRKDGRNSIVYAPLELGNRGSFNTISIPRRCEYRLKLSDGSIVWLNAETKLVFPVDFKSGPREVELEGEAFFDVVRMDGKPFVVHTRKFDVRVTGTAFNVRAYAGETESATLAEGEIGLEKEGCVYRLCPGEQAYIRNDGVEIKKVDVREEISWRYGAFCFKDACLEDIMRDLIRWYGVEVEYETPELKKLHFTAWFRRTADLREVIDLLEKTGKISIDIKNRTMVIKSNGAENR